jgi:hypothetical protein
MKLTKWMIVASILTLSGCGDTTNSQGTGEANSGGSLAAMASIENRLYILNDDEIVSLEIEESGGLVNQLRTTTDLFQTETLMSYQDEYLLVGTEFGVSIFSVSDAEDSETPPSEVGSFNHARAYDPIIARNKIGYITTRDGEPLESNASDQLIILDLTNLEEPIQITEINEFNEPAGLALFDNKLFICDLYLGLMEYEILNDTSPETIEVKYVARHSEYDCHDVIVRDNTLVLVSQQSVTQVSIESESLSKLSEIFTYSGL